MEIIQDNRIPHRIRELLHEVNNRITGHFMVCLDQVIQGSLRVAVFFYQV